MSCLTRKEQIAVCFLVFCLLVGGAISLWDYHNPERFAELRIVPGNPPPADSLALPATGKLNINTATAEQLSSLPGIGPEIAQRIIQWREENGPFETVADLDRVRGIGDKRLAKMITLIEVRN